MNLSRKSNSLRKAFSIFASQTFQSFQEKLILDEKSNIGFFQSIEAKIENRNELVEMHP